MKIPGEPLRILTAENGNFKLHEENLEKVLLDKEVQDKSVMVVAIVGPSRKGKSFLINFLLRFMAATYINDDPDWLVDDQSPLEGFDWSGGSGKVTVGMYIWSHPFIVKLPSSREVAVLFLDTQGTFDSESSLIEDTSIFALSSLCSSLLIYNLPNDILSIDLMHLQLFINYGLIALDYEQQLGFSNVTPFQKLVMLIRDYSFKNEYGEEEGKRHMKSRFTTDNKETKSTIANIRNCFSDVTCFVLPSIGFKTARNEIFSGMIADIDVKFIEQLKVLAPSLLLSENIVTKEIMGESVTAKQLFGCFKSYLEIFNSGDLPEPKTIFEATIEINNLVATDKAKDTYIRLMEAEFGGSMPYSVPSRVKNKHLEIKSIAIAQFHNSLKMGGQQYSMPYEQKLVNDLDRMVLSYVKYNNRKSIARTLRTPGIFLAMSLGCYLLSIVFSTFHYQLLVVSCNMVTALSMITFMLMTYIRITRVLER